MSDILDQGRGNRSGDSTPLTTTLRARTWSRASSSGDSSLPVNTTPRKSFNTGVSPSRSRTSKPDISGRRRSRKNYAVEGFFHHSGQRFCPCGSDGNINAVVTQQFTNTELFRGIIFHDQQALAARLRIFLDSS